MNKAGYLIIILVIMVFTACKSLAQLNSRGQTVYLRTFFYDTSGLKFIDTTKIWYKDSMAIHELHSIQIHTDTENKTTVKFKIFGYRFIDLRNKMYYDYKTLSDTARHTGKSVLPDTAFSVGWAFYSHKARQIDGSPELISDTTIENILYRRIRFRLRNSKENIYSIGYLRCDRKEMMFSLEKSYSAMQNCAMTKMVFFEFGKAWPVFSFSVEYISDTLPQDINKVLAAWSTQNH